MKVVLQRVRKASVSIDGKLYSQIATGILTLVGIGKEDNEEDIEWLCRKIARLRIFDDNEGVMNLSVADIGGDVMVVSQFTLMASTSHGNRPSYIAAAPPDFSVPLYEKFVAAMEASLNKKVATGVFGADMKIELVNDGPVTIIIDSKNRI